MKLSKAQIDEVCKEIELQWDYLLMAKSVFYNEFYHADEFTSPSFYKKNGFSFKVVIAEPKSKRWLKAANGVSNWLNQNFIIRLYGILDSKNIRKTENKPEIIQLIETLRPKVGAHTTGSHSPHKSVLKKATQLINSLFNAGINENEVQNFELSIDTVLEPMKVLLIKYIKSLEK